MDVLKRCSQLQLLVLMCIRPGVRGACSYGSDRFAQKDCDQVASWSYMHVGRRCWIWTVAGAIVVGVQLFLGMLLLASPAHAETRAWLDRDAISVGESVTLTIQTDQPAVKPDYAPLSAGFSLSGQSSSRQVDVVNGRRSTRWLFEVILVPHQTGELTLPSLRVGAESTSALSLSVAASTATSSAGSSEPQASDVVFVQTSVDDLRPYVQQSVGVTVRLYFATELASGLLDLDTPDGGRLLRIGEDISTYAQVNGRDYNVIERHFILVPDHSGPLVLPGARFRGRAGGGRLASYFGASGGELSARSAAISLQVQPQPGMAPEPWLPLRALELHYIHTPQAAVAGEATEILIEASIVGASKQQFPELPTFAVADAQVFAEPTQYQEDFINGSTQLKLSRRYSIVPHQPGRLHVPGLEVGWWDVAAGVARKSTLPDLELDVAPGRGEFSASATQSTVEPAVQPQSALALSRNQNADVLHPWAWIVAALVFAFLWLATLAWGLLYRRQAKVGAASVVAGRPAASQRSRLAELRKAIDVGGLDEVATILCAMAGVSTLDQVVERLQSQPQREAIAYLQRARWAGQGDVVSARQGLRAAFRQGPDWLPTAAVQEAVLEPLYPTRHGGR